MFALTHLNQFIVDFLMYIYIQELQKVSNWVVLGKPGILNKTFLSQPSELKNRTSICQHNIRIYFQFWHFSCQWGHNDHPTPRHPTVFNCRTSTRWSSRNSPGGSIKFIFKVIQWIIPKNKVSICTKLRHCAYITYIQRETWFLKNLSVPKDKCQRRKKKLNISIIFVVERI